MAPLPRDRELGYVPAYMGTGPSRERNGTKGKTKILIS